MVRGQGVVKSVAMVRVRVELEQEPNRECVTVATTAPV